MDLRSVLASVIAGVSVFTFFSLPILREMYGDVALLAVYAGLGLLTSILVYIIVSKITSIEFGSADSEEYTKDKEETDSEEDENGREDELVEEEVEALRNQ